MRSPKRRPYISLPVGFKREHALSGKQFADYWALCELAWERWADQSEDRFQCRGVDLARALEVGGQGAGVANAVRSVRALPKQLVQIERDRERRGVWWVTLPGFGDLQGLSGRGPRQVPATPGVGPATPSPAPAIPGDAPAVPGDAPAGVAGGRKTETAQGPRVASHPIPSQPDPSRPVPRQRRDARTRAAEGVDIPDAMPTEVRESVERGARFMNPNVRECLQNEGYLSDEWRRFARHHRSAGTVVRSLEALFCRWLKNPKSGERAHERLKRETERIATGALLTRSVRRAAGPESLGSATRALPARKVP